MDLSFKNRSRSFLNWTLLVTIGSLLLAGCLPDPLPVEELPVLKPKITVSSQIIPQQGLVVFLTRSIGALDASDDSNPQTLLNQVVITDALVTLHYLGIVDTLTSLGSGLYGGIAEVEWQERLLYELRVSSPELGEVNAFAEVQTPISFATADARLFVTEFDSLAEITYSVQDPSGPNYYMINVQQISSEQSLTSLLDPDVFTYLLEDNVFDGQLYEDQFRVFFRDFSEGDTVSVQLANIQKKYYDFLKLRNDNRTSITDFASEPVNYPTNVNGGLGFFNLHLPDVRLFLLEE